MRRVLATLATGALATPVAGMVGGLVLYLSLWLQRDDAGLLLAATFVVYGALLGSLQAWPVTLLLLPVCTMLLLTLCLQRHARWLAPVGMLGGTLVLLWPLLDAADASIADAFLEPTRLLVLAGAAGGAAAGLLFALLARALPQP